EWTIPAANEPTFVDYSIKAFDDLNQSQISPTYTFLMDFAPSVSILDPVSWIVLRADQDLLVNVSAVDPDGPGTINTSSGIVYYRLFGGNWSEVNLNYYGKPPGSDIHYFTCTIPASNIKGIETYMEIRANISDIVDEKKGREDVSSPRYVYIDSLAPRITDIAIEKYPGLQKNITSTTSPVNIDITAVDDNGISSVSIYYSIPNGTAFRKGEMTNTSLIGSSEDISTFNMVLPASNETAFIEYFFETEDFFGNKGNTSLNFYYSDGSGPVLDTLSIYPTIISNYTKVLVLFNSSDYSGSMPSVLWYSFDNQISWEFIEASKINYQADLTSETFTATDLHYIKDNAVSSFPLEVI
ncbi:MAG: hypothetical protein ACFFDT_40535, partial [Candidatus Hodarchaeota archaeon]